MYVQRDTKVSSRNHVTVEKQYVLHIACVGL